MISPQKQKLLELYKDGEWKCSVEITPLFIRDYRKRISELNQSGYVFQSMRCDGRCGVNHASNVHMYRLTEKPTVKKWVYELVNGVRVPREITVEV